MATLKYVVVQLQKPPYAHILYVCASGLDVSLDSATARSAMHDHQPVINRCRLLSGPVCHCLVRVLSFNETGIQLLKYFLRNVISNTRLVQVCNPYAYAFICTTNGYAR
jgi:hypothetical protein